MRLYFIKIYCNVKEEIILSLFFLQIHVFYIKINFIFLNRIICSSHLLKIKKLLAKKCFNLNLIKFIIYI